MSFLHDAYFASSLEYSVPKKSPLDLHVLGTPPAFVLSQDQTLKLICDLILRFKLNHLPNSKEFWFLSFTLFSFQGSIRIAISCAFRRQTASSCAHVYLYTLRAFLLVFLELLASCNPRIRPVRPFVIWKILRIFSYLADESAVDLYYVITQLMCCQYGFFWFFMAIYRFDSSSLCTYFEAGIIY